MLKSVEEAQVLYDNALTNYRKNKTKDALMNLKEILFIAEGDLRVKTYDLLAKICVDKAKLKEALTFYTNALKHVAEEDYARQANLYNKLGLVCMATQQIDDALKYQNACLNSAEKDGNQESISVTLRNLGRLYTLKGDHVKALRLHQKSLEIKRTLGDKLGEARNYETMAQNFEFSENYDDAVEQYNKALELYQELGKHSEVTRLENAIKNVSSIQEGISEYDQDEMFEMQLGNFL